MKLLAFSGKKQSGKDTAARFVKRNAELFWGDSQHAWEEPPLVVTLYFGGPMKDFAENWLGVEHHKLWGTDEQKNELTHVRWQDLPHYDRLAREIGVRLVRRYGCFVATWPEEHERIPTGPMTGRQLLQQIGEEMFLTMNPRIWTGCFKRDFEAFSGTDGMVLVADPRKPEQIDTIHELGGKVIRFSRDPYASADRHISEIALDVGNYDQRNFDAIIDNANLSIRETHAQVLELLIRWGWIASEVDTTKVNWEPREAA